MLDKFKGYGKLSKILLVTVTILGVALIGLVIAICCTGGF